MAENVNQKWDTLILLVGTASGVFAGFCPSWFTVASDFFNDNGAREGNIKRIRQGEAAATAIVLAMGYAVARSTSNKAAFWAAAGICGVFVGGYEWQIAHPSRDDGGSSSTTSLWSRSSKAA